jgi:hypothetical protein
VPDQRRRGDQGPLAPGHGRVSRRARPVVEIDLSRHLGAEADTRTDLGELDVEPLF